MVRSVAQRRVSNHAGARRCPSFETPAARAPQDEAEFFAAHDVKQPAPSRVLVLRPVRPVSFLSLICMTLMLPVHKVRHSVGQSLPRLFGGTYATFTSFFYRVARLRIFVQQSRDHSSTIVAAVFGPRDSRLLWSFEIDAGLARCHKHLPPCSGGLCWHGNCHGRAPPESFCSTTAALATLPTWRLERSNGSLFCYGDAGL